MPYAVSDEKLEEIKDLNDIVDVLGEFIELKRAGTNYKALCPFHNEKTPSFVVSPDKQIYHCFGCGEGGDVFSFLMKYNNYTFMEAVEYLADKVGIKLEQVSEKNSEKKELLYKINREAAIYFYGNLKKSKESINYLRRRGIDSKSIKKFGIGYALDSWNGLLDHLKSKNYKDKDIADTGLVIERNKSEGYYDRFRNRIIFPIINTKKQVIGFGGRVLDDSLPKYLNSPDSEIFSKGKYLYNLNNSIKNKETNYIILTEGYMDVIKLSINGYNNTVASLGTALTKHQIRLLKKYYDLFYIAYDSDESGKKAAIKALNLFKNQNLEAKVIVFPNNMDPDDYISKYGKSKFRERLNENLDYFEFLHSYYSSKYDINTNKGKVKYIEEFFGNINNVSNSIERELIIEKISEKTQISKENLLKEFSKKYLNKKKFKSDFKKKKKEVKGINIENYFTTLAEKVSKNEELYEYTVNKYSETFKKIFGNNFFEDYNFKLTKDYSFENSLSTDEIDFMVNKILIKYQEKQLSELRHKLNNNPNNEEILTEISKIYKEIKILRQGGIN